jgi:hypothetical protein
VPRSCADLYDALPDGPRAEYDRRYGHALTALDRNAVRAVLPYQVWRMVRRRYMSLAVRSPLWQSTIRLRYPKGDRPPMLLGDHERDRRGVRVMAGFAGDCWLAGFGVVHRLDSRSRGLRERASVVDRLQAAHQEQPPGICAGEQEVFGFVGCLVTSR